ncbi:unnamed protein product [Notodromas monacha]|uniref:COX assembly mitochondrial protein n=1 Tax=Notodromas monacha TaxID=399045 RepID=A0A7R9BNE2_9CRUS|nr:unnamed protein product [Notodromas monacha]CAG0917183.1 unnamed protein product [Notodromas monacha]
MHPDLSSHLHGAECNELIAALKKCHADNKFKKFVGACNSVDAALTKCLKRELESNRLKNNKKARERQAESQRRMAAES